MSIKVRRVLVAVNTVVLIILIMGMLRIAIPNTVERSKNAVELRNSLLARVGSPRDFLWDPKNVPYGFLAEHRATPSFFALAVKNVLEPLGREASSFHKAIALAYHLQASPVPVDGQPVMGTSVETYRSILEDRSGYCADFSQVFNALALAAGVGVREWGIGFGGFGAGHAFNEIYDETFNKWILIDTFYSFYVVDKKNGVPLSALEFQRVLRRKTDEEMVRIVPISKTNFGFESEARLYRYYEQGADQFFLYWGNNVYSYDGHPVVKAATRLHSRSAEQLAAILVGVHPGIRIVPTDTNKGCVAMLFDMRSRLILHIALIIFLTVSLAILGLSLVAGKRSWP